MPPVSLPTPLRAFRLAVAASLALLMALPAVADAARSQNGADMFIINPGGGRQPDGSDGMLAVVNGINQGDANFTIGGGGKWFAPSPGSDQQWFATTEMWISNVFWGP